MMLANGSASAAATAATKMILAFTTPPLSVPPALYLAGVQKRLQESVRALAGNRYSVSASLRRTGLSSRRMEIDFWHDGDQGRVTVTCVPNSDPAAVGKSEEARGFPVCSATIAYPGRGYRALFGWVQLVCSTDNALGTRVLIRGVCAAPRPAGQFSCRVVRLAVRRHPCEADSLTIRPSSAPNERQPLST
jgi:hypothetical protein